MIELKKKRIEYIDITKGIAILLMIVGHTLQAGWKRSLIYSFHMPLFILISGFLYKENKSIKTTLITIVKKLLLPCFITLIITDILKYLIYHDSLNCNQLIMQIILSHTNKVGDTLGLGVLWFLPFLGIIRIIFTVINKYFSNYTVFGIVILFSLVGFLLGKHKLFLPWSIDIALVALIFYYVGFLIKKKDLLSKINIFLLFLLFIVGLCFQNIELATRSYPGYYICVNTAIAGSLLIIKFSFLLNKKVPNIMKIFSWYGRNSLKILCFHYLEKNIIYYEAFGITSKLSLIISKIIIVTILTLIFNFIINFLKKIHFNNLKKDNLKLLAWHMWLML